MKCFICNVEHDGTFGSGKFCCRACANSRQHSEETKAKIGSAQPKAIRFTHICKQCKLHFETSFSKRNQKFCSHSCSTKFTSKTENLSVKTRQKLSENALRRHAKADGKIGFTTRKKFQSSFPELITEQFLDKRNIKYEREIRFGKWFADFVIGKSILEIDGKQHRLPDRALKDKEKDNYLSALGYKVTRVAYNGLNEQFFTELENFTSIAQR